MTRPTYVRASDGAIVPEAEATRDGVMRSGYAMRMHTVISDGAPNLFLQDGDRLEECRARIRDAYDARVSNNWKTPSAQQSEAAATLAVDAPPNSLAESYAARDRRIANNWRNA